MSPFAPTLSQTRAYFEDRLGVRLSNRTQVSVKCPFHEDGEPSMSLNLGEGVWRCFVCDLQGGILDFERQLTRRLDAECWETINQTIGRDTPIARQFKQARIVATYDYRDASGKLVYQSVRYEPKSFRQRRPDGNGGFTWNMEGVERVPFNLPLVVRANVVLIAEGEKDASRLQSAATDFPNENGTLVYAATTNVAGAGKWLNSYSPYVTGKQVFVFADNDEKGRKHALEVCSSVGAYAREVRLVHLQDLPGKGDVFDYLANHTAEELFGQMEAAPVWGAPAASASSFDSPEALAMVTANLLAQVKTWILRYVVVTEHQATILAVWVLHTHVLAAAYMTPYLQITAAEKECGKSLLMDVLAALARKPIRAGGMTPAALVRTIDAYQPTLFLDEMDAAMGGNKEFAETLRGILNEGFHCEGKVHKCEGRNHDLREFKVFGCKAFAGIGRLQDTVASRSIPIEMRRRLPSEQVTPFRSRAVRNAAMPIRNALEDWANKAMPLLKTLVPEPLRALGDRQNDIAEPLLAIAQLAGDEWPRCLAQALLAVYASAVAEDMSDGVMLLTDIRSLFERHTTDRLASQQVVELLGKSKVAPGRIICEGSRSPRTSSQRCSRSTTSIRARSGWAIALQRGIAGRVLRTHGNVTAHSGPLQLQQRHKQRLH